MNFTNIIILLLFVNSIAHIISFFELNKTKAPNRWGVLAYVFILAILGVFMMQKVSWAVYPALIFPTIGMLALSNEVRQKGGSGIDYTILGLDLVTIGLLVYSFFFQ